MASETAVANSANRGGRTSPTGSGCQSCCLAGILGGGLPWLVKYPAVLGSGLLACHASKALLLSP